MSLLDTAVRAQLLNEISTIFHDDNVSSERSTPFESLTSDETLSSEKKSKRRRHHSVEEVVEGDPFAGVEDENGLLMEPKVELQEFKDEPAEIDLDFHYDNDVVESEPSAHVYLEQPVTPANVYLEDFQSEVNHSPYFLGSDYADVLNNRATEVNQETFMCSVCNSVFVEQSRLRIHMRRKHNLLKHTFKFNCDICGESYDQKNSLLVHMKRLHGPKAVVREDDKTELNCNICGSVLLGKRRLRFHMHRKHKVEDKPFKFQCSKCPSSYDRLSSLKLHKQRKHTSCKKKRQDIRCPVCPKMFTNRCSYMAHLRRIHQSQDGSKVILKNSAGVPENSEETLDVPINYSEGNNELACSQCPLLFADINRLRLHMKRVHNANFESFRYKCSFCSLTYDKRASLVRHVARKHNKDLYCEPCKKQFTSHESFVNHSHTDVNIGEQTPVYQCGVCKMIYLREGTLAKHMRKAHDVATPDMSVFCELCGRGFYQQKYLRSHMKKMHSDLSYTCQFCHNIFNLKSTLRQHIFRNHKTDVTLSGNTTFRCKQCTSSFSNEKDLCNHIALNHTGKEAVLDLKTEEQHESIPHQPDEKSDIKPDKNAKMHLQCTECGIQFETWSKLRQHFKIQHLEDVNSTMKVVCQHCGLVTTSAILTRHMVIAHKDLIEVFKCGQCNYKTSKKHLLVKHQSSHTSEKKYSCPVQGCSFKTHNKYNIRPHSATHAEKVKLYCSKCAFGTNDPHIMKNHENEHVTGKKRYNCDQCDYATNLPANIISHRFKHSDERCFKCNECSFDTKYSTALWLHKRQKHSDKPPLQNSKRKTAKLTVKKDKSLKRNLARLAEQTVKSKP